MEPEIKYRIADASDIPAITAFVDFWLKGQGLPAKIPGSAHDYFVPAGRHPKYVTTYITLLALLENCIVGWAVKTHKGVLIHLLIAGTFRNEGIGSKMLELMDPDTIRSKMDQSAGDPAEFYGKRGYLKNSIRPSTKKNNIEIFQKARDFTPTSSSPAHSREVAENSTRKTRYSTAKKQREKKQNQIKTEIKVYNTK